MTNGESTILSIIKGICATEHSATVQRLARMVNRSAPEICEAVDALEAEGKVKITHIKNGGVFINAVDEDGDIICFGMKVLELRGGK